MDKIKEIKIGGPGIEPNYNALVVQGIGRIILAILLVFVVVWLFNEKKKVAYLIAPIALYQAGRIFYAPPFDFGNEGSLIENVRRNRERAKENKEAPAKNLGHQPYKV